MVFVVLVCSDLDLVRICYTSHRWQEGGGVVSTHLCGLGVSIVSPQVKDREHGEDGEAGEGRECEEENVEAGEDGESEEGEEMKKVADVKYDVFQRECGDLLDQSLAAEFSLMQSLGLPTKLINSYGDMESGVGTVFSV